ncbi:MAG TPA: DM13 domain-containing protein [Actinomycetota bacterium]|nr:DM13 domain-containing protein [Actinomycetota bacterium]
MSRNRLWVVAALVVVGLLIFVFFWFQPQKLLIEDTVSEAPPRVVPTADETRPETTLTLARGEFRSLEHDTHGTATTLEIPDGRRYLRLEGLDTSNGPDLRVYLSEIPASDDWYAYGERFVDLGSLKGNRGDQNYALPEGLDLSRFKSAVIWCRRFTVGFGVAPLERV